MASELRILSSGLLSFTGHIGKVEGNVAGWVVTGVSEFESSARRSRWCKKPAAVESSKFKHWEL